MKQELKDIEEFNKIFPIETIEKIRLAKGEYIDDLIDSIRYATENAKALYESKSKYFLHVYAIYLLAEFREKKAFPVIADFVELDQKLFEFLTEERMVTDNLAIILASTYNGDQQRLTQIIENKEASEYVRSCALDACELLVCEQLIEKKDFEHYLRGFIKMKIKAGPEDDQNGLVFITLLTVIMNLNLYDLRFIVYDLYDNGFIDSFFVGDYEEFIDEVFRKSRTKEAYMDDAIEKLIKYKPFKNAKQYSPKKVKLSKMKDIIEWDVQYYRDSYFSKDIMNKYPPLKGRYGLKGLSDFYDDEAIEIDKAMYKAMANTKSYNMFFDAFTTLMDEKEDSKKENELLEYFELGYDLFLEKAARENIKQLAAYDKKHMIHFPVMLFIDGYSTLLYKEARRMSKPKYLLQAIEIMQEILDKFTLKRRYRSFLVNKIKRYQEAADHPFFYF